MAVTKALTTLALLLHASSILAVDFGVPIAGCAEVDCPTSGNSTSADCKVADRNIVAIGLANLDVPLGNDFTWTQGVEVYENLTSDGPSNRAFEKNFYFGSPQGFNLTANATSSGYGACALFFTQVSDKVAFDGDNIVQSTGTCNDALNQNCVNALTSLATDAASLKNSTINNPSTQDICQSVQENLVNNMPSECVTFSTGDKWQGLKVQGMIEPRSFAEKLPRQLTHKFPALTGPNAPQPLSAAENSTSNCYPTLPKSNSLTHVAAFNTTGTLQLATVEAKLYSITPILTVFFPEGNGTTTVFPRPRSQVSCVKSIGVTDAAKPVGTLYA